MLVLKPQVQLFIDSYLTTCIWPAVAKKFKKAGKNMPKLQEGVQSAWAGKFLPPLDGLLPKSPLLSDDESQKTLKVTLYLCGGWCRQTITGDETQG